MGRILLAVREGKESAASGGEAALALLLEFRMRGFIYRSVSMVTVISGTKTYAFFLLFHL